MLPLVSALLRGAEQADAALVVCDGQDRILQVNRRHAEIYDFIDYERPTSFEEFLWGSIRNKKMACLGVYQNPAAWIGAAKQVLDMNSYYQFVTRHTDGRVMMVYYESIGAADRIWYQARVDITESLRKHRDDRYLITSAPFLNSAFAPVCHPTLVPFKNVLEAISEPAALILEGAYLLEANRPMLALLRTGDGLIQVEDRVVARAPAERAELQRRLERFFGAGSAGQPVAMRVAREGSDQPYYLSLMPLAGPESQICHEGMIGLLKVADPSLVAAIDPTLLKDFLGLTLAEAEVAAALAAGANVAAIAARRNVQPNTIYAHIKRILEKTGYRNQSEIVRRVADLARIFGTQVAYGR